MAETTPNSICRLCAKLKDDVVENGDPGYHELGIQTKSAKYLNIQITETDELPQSVCVDCCDLLYQFGEFYELTNSAQTSLKESLIKSKACKEESKKNDDDKLEKPSCNGETSSKTIELDEELILDHSEGEIEKEDEENQDENDYKNEKKEENENSADKEKPKEVKKKVIRKSKRKSNSESEDDLDLNSKRPETKKEKQKMKKLLENYQWLCTDCNDKLSSLEMLEKHHQTVHNQQPKFMCVQCCKVYDKYFGFLSHLKRHKSQDKYVCNDCGKSFLQKKMLQSHQAIHSDQRPHKCETCGKTFRQQSALCIHSRCHLPEEKKNRYPCDQCNKRFSTKPNLVTHKRIHSGIRNFVCDLCGKSFVQKGNLEAHFLTHSNDKPFTCPECNKNFKTRLQLKKHESVHTGAKDHQCQICRRRFREKSTLREHHRIHTGAMPFKCEFCGKSFRFKGILTTHRRQHTGEKPYCCNECQHRFTNWPNYNKHMKRRHGIDTSQKNNQQEQSKPQQKRNQQAQDDQQNSNVQEIVQEGIMKVEVPREQEIVRRHIVVRQREDGDPTEPEEILPHDAPSSYVQVVQSPRSSPTQLIHAIPTSLLQNSSLSEYNSVFDENGQRINYFTVPVMQAVALTANESVHYQPPNE